MRPSVMRRPMMRRAWPWLLVVLMLSLVGQGVWKEQTAGFVCWLVMVAALLALLTLGIRALRVRRRTA
jgi:hypothetical protein